MPPTANKLSSMNKGEAKRLASTQCSVFRTLPSGEPVEPTKERVILARKGLLAVPMITNGGFSHGGGRVRDDSSQDTARDRRISVM